MPHSTDYPAHIRYDHNSNGYIVQSVQEHCVNTAEYASAFLKSVNLEQTGKILGKYHDFGKYTEEFKRYIWKAVHREPVVRGSVNHTFAGVKLFERQMQSNDINEKLCAELIACVMGSHHGLFDVEGPEGINGIQYRLDEEKPLFQEAVLNSSPLYFSQQQLTLDFNSSFHEIKNTIRSICDANKWKGHGVEDFSFYLGSLARLMCSALIDADRLDTAEFACNQKFQFKTATREMWQTRIQYLEHHLAARPVVTPIEMARAKLSLQCKEAGRLYGTGIYRLDLPTGAGKTIASLRCALEHAVTYGKKRIISASPLLGIIDQNAAVWHEYLGDDSIVLESHSNVVNEKGKKSVVKDLLAETWNSPVVITTFVQLLNAMFSGQTSSVRRFHALCDSIILIDEIQNLPVNMLSMFHLMASFLTNMCNTTFIFCSATQPSSEASKHPYNPAPIDLVPYDRKIWDVFKRTTIHQPKDLKFKDIPDYILTNSENCTSALVIVNTKSEAKTLFNKLKRRFKGKVFHMSADMCRENRSVMLLEIERVLADGTEPCLCISTQLMEQGIDKSFVCGFRFMAGLDNIVQTDGRINRNGVNTGFADMYIINCIDENLGKLNEIQNAKNAMIEFNAMFQKAPHLFDNDIKSRKSTEAYYSILYRNLKKTDQDYPTDENGTLLDLLSRNMKYTSVSGTSFLMTQAFKTAGELFTVFDEEATIIVPYRDGAKIIDQIRNIGDKTDPISLQQLKILVEKAKPYMVTVYPNSLNKLQKRDAVDLLCNETIMVLKPDKNGILPYDDELGLCADE